MKNFIETFITQAKLYPEKPSIIFRGKEISYKQLDECSNVLARHLISLGATSEKIIPLILKRDTNTIVSMLAVLKAGCAFLPISPITPCARIKFILEDTDATLVISNVNLNHIKNESITIIEPSCVKASNNFALPPIILNQLAYVMYTSGSTGNPKGVLIEHESMMNLFCSLIEELNITEREQILALTDYTFDISLIELLMPLLKGATILLTEQGTVADGVKIKQYIEKNDITFIQATPLTWEILIKQGWKNDGKIRILVGGEKFKTQLAELLDYKKENIWNMYGPTETSMWSMFNHIKKTLTTESVPLGIPIKNTIIKLLDNDMNEVQPKSQGEIYIGGLGLARGYLNNQKLTNQKFIYHPYTQERLYKTGDLAVCLNADEICYQGRLDDQLKFGGIRVEAGEIESVIEQEPFVKKAVVKVHETEGYYKSLAAYVEVDEEKIFSNNIPINTDSSLFLKDIYNEIYSDAENYEHESINNCGWQSSFTGQIFGAEELNESYQFIRKTINASDLSDVLEVGCGTGGLLLEYIDKVSACTVVEISSTAIEYLKKRLSKQQQKKITFKNQSAINIHDHKKYSCIIINSVIQYLPSINSLITTLSQLVTATKPQGTIIIGDVRSLELMDIYLLEKIRLNNLKEDNKDLNLSSFYYKSRDTEIVLSPKFFFALKKMIPDISHIDISVKHGSYKNELNYFRYDVILYINKAINYQLPTIIDYSTTLTISTIKTIIKSNIKNIFIIRNIPNKYIQDMLRKIEQEVPNNFIISSSHDKNNETINTALQINYLINNKIKTHEKFIIYDRENPINDLEIHLYPNTQEITRIREETKYKHYRYYCREPFNPWLQKFCFDHIKLKIRQHIVSWVNPSVYIWVEKWPLSINGKLDKKRLHLPETLEIHDSKKNILGQLQTIWRNITGDNTLVDKEFWTLGISSLCLYFFLANINETFFVNINYHEFREYNTLNKLALYLEKLTNT
ncbi:MAG: amino acid adenylation domain-containing protein [Silvanigrellaceae bacterium]|nr:amino acid adenylation domain-containing protein [Silvanigrellaceae bacterium]